MPRDGPQAGQGLAGQAVAAPLDLGQRAGADANPAGQLGLGQASADALRADLLADLPPRTGCAFLGPRLSPSSPTTYRRERPVTSAGVPVGLDDLQGLARPARSAPELRSTTTWVMSASWDRNVGGWVSRSTSQ